LNSLWRTDCLSLSRPERVFRAIWQLEAEVNSGGFHQYFLNSTGSLARETVDALRAIGADSMAGVVERAIEVIGYEHLESDDARTSKLASAGPGTLEKLDELDQAFYAYPDDLTGLLYKYVSKHAGEMAVPEEFYLHSDALRERAAASRGGTFADLIRRPYFLIVIMIMMLAVLGSLMAT
jgi:hypothetical protein